MNTRELVTCALALYWGEGAKSLSARQVDLANGDPSMLKIFLRYLREIRSVDERRLRVYLYCFEDQDAARLVDFWSQELDIPPGQFAKPYVRPVTALLKRRLPHGVAHVRYSDKRLLLSLLSEIEKMKSWAGCRAVKCTRL